MRPDAASVPATLPAAVAPVALTGCRSFCCRFGSDAGSCHRPINNASRRHDRCNNTARDAAGGRNGGTAATNPSTEPATQPFATTGPSTQPAVAGVPGAVAEPAYAQPPHIAPRPASCQRITLFWRSEAFSRRAVTLLICRTPSARGAFDGSASGSRGIAGAKSNSREPQLVFDRAATAGNQHHNARVYGGSRNCKHADIAGRRQSRHRHDLGDQPRRFGLHIRRAHHSRAGPGKTSTAWTRRPVKARPSPSRCPPATTQSAGVAGGPPGTTAGTPPAYPASPNPAASGSGANINDIVARLRARRAAQQRELNMAASRRKLALLTSAVALAVGPIALHAQIVPIAPALRRRIVPATQPAGRGRPAAADCATIRDFAHHRPDNPGQPEFCRCARSRLSWNVFPMKQASFILKPGPGAYSRENDCAQREAHQCRGSSQAAEFGAHGQWLYGDSNGPHSQD